MVHPLHSLLMVHLPRHLHMVPLLDNSLHTVRHLDNSPLTERPLRTVLLLVNSPIPLRISTTLSRATSNLMVTAPPRATTTVVPRHLLPSDSLPERLSVLLAGMRSTTKALSVGTM
jgi:hypothetical protein